MVPPRERSANVPVAVSDIVMKLLQKEPENRYQSANGLAADLSACVAVVAAGGALEPFPLGLQDVVDRFEPPQKLYGRSAETQVLLQSFERAGVSPDEIDIVINTHLHFDHCGWNTYYKDGKPEPTFRNFVAVVLLALLAARPHTRARERAGTS